MTPNKRSIAATLSFFLGLGLTLSGLAFAEGLGVKEDIDTCTGKSNLTAKPDDAQMAILNSASPLPSSENAN